MAEGYAERQEDRLEMMAIHACWVINATGWIKKAVRPQQLLKTRKKDRKPDMSPDEVKRFLWESAHAVKQHEWGLLDDKFAKSWEEAHGINKDNK